MRGAMVLGVGFGGGSERKDDVNNIDFAIFAKTVGVGVCCYLHPSRTCYEADG